MKSDLKSCKSPKGPPRGSSKGSFYALESAIAIVLMVTTLALIVRQPTTPREYDIVNYKLKVYSVLKISDDVGDLRTNVLNNNTDAIKSEIESSVHLYLNYEVVIYNRTGPISGVPSIDSENVATVSYFLAGRVGNYDPREVRIFMWGFD